MILFLMAVFAAAQATGPEGRWEGVLDAGQAKLRLVVDIQKSSDGLMTGVLNSVDQGAKIPIDKVEFDGGKIRFQVRAVKGSFEGAVNEAGTKLTGTWTQGASLPLELTRVAAAAAPKPAAARTASFPPPFELRTLAPPASVSGNGKTHLAWELAITNFSAGEFLLKRIEVWGDGKPLASFEAEELNGILARPTGGSMDKRTLDGGQMAVAFLWATVDGPAPAKLRHKVSADAGAVEGGETAVNAAAPVVLGPPLRGGGWIAVNGPDNASIHRRALMPIEGGLLVAQRFAIDWVRRPGGDGKENKTYPAWGAEALAAADGVVSSVKDGIPENVPGPRSRAVPMTLETLGGNYVMLDLGGERFAFYAHLQPGSLRVKPGDKVRRGDVLGLVGNSGNSTEPHLHFQIAAGRSPLASNGLPFVFESFETEGKLRRNEIPMQNAVVRFP